MKKPKPKILALDFDGTLCEYDGWKGPAHFGKPYPDVVAELHKLKACDEKWAIVIFTTRRTDHALRMHLDKYNILYDYINKHPWQPPDSSHKMTADVYLDDHALRFNGNATGLARRIREAAMTWTEREKVGQINIDEDATGMLQDEGFAKRSAFVRDIFTHMTGPSYDHEKQKRDD